MVYPKGIVARLGCPSEARYATVEQLQCWGEFVRDEFQDPSEERKAFLRDYPDKVREGEERATWRGVGLSVSLFLGICPPGTVTHGPRGAMLFVRCFLQAVLVAQAGTMCFKQVSSTKQVQRFRKKLQDKRHLHRNRT